MDIAAVSAVPLLTPLTPGGRGVSAGEGQDTGRVQTRKAPPSASRSAALQEQRNAREEPAAEHKQVIASATEAPASVGRIRFELEEGTRVAKFFNTKDVLIYQVPPEGRVYLLRAQETPGKDQIETSA